LIALEKMPARLCEDHENARLLADRLSRIHTLLLDAARVRTNIVVVDVSRTGFDSGKLAGLLKSRGVLVGTVNSTTIRLLTHFDVSRAQIEEAAKIFSSVLGGDNSS
jgi:threonine aldolase